MESVADTAQPYRVLVVDDEPNVVDVISMALRFQGFHVETAGTGQEAISAIAGFRPHLMVLDVMLPDMEGFEVAQRLGAQRAHVPIVFLTARDATEDKIRGLTTGGDDYVTKPFSLEELLARVRNVLRRSGRAEPESSRLSFEDLELDEDSREVTRAHQQERHGGEHEHRRQQPRAQRGHHSGAPQLTSAAGAARSPRRAPCG